MQLRDLRAYAKRRGWGSPAAFVDHGVSGAKGSRPELDRLMGLARQRKVDAIVVWSLDRFGRSMQHLITALNELASLRVAFLVPNQGIDTSDDTPAGRFQVQIIAAVAEFERGMIRARVLAGIEKARAEGKPLGRPRKVIDIEGARARVALEGLRPTARSLGVPPPTLRRALARGR